MTRFGHRMRLRYGEFEMKLWIDRQGEQLQPTRSQASNRGPWIVEPRNRRHWREKQMFRHSRIPTVIFTTFFGLAMHAYGQTGHDAKSEYDIGSHEKISKTIAELTKGAAYPDHAANMDAAKPLGISCVHIDPRVEKSQADVKVELRNATDKTAIVSVGAGLTEKEPAVTKGSITLGPRGTAEVLLSVPINKPRLWSPENPNLTDMYVSVVDAAGKPIDCRKERFGMRSFKIGEDLRFYLNGRPVYLRGNTWVPAGYALIPFEPAFCRRMMIEQKKQGFNYLRHHSTVPPYDWYYDMADELGLMVEIEMGFDVERSRKVIEQYYNHPCIVIWGGVNEEHKTGTRPEVQTWYKLVKSLDPSRYVIDTSGWGEYDRDTTDILNQHLGYEYPYLHCEDMYSQYNYYSMMGSCKGVSDAEIARRIREGTFRVDKPQTIHELQGNAQVYSENSLVLDSRMRRVWESFGFDYADWPTYWKTCQKFANVSYKLNMEAARRSDATSGFDWLTVADSTPEMIRESRWPCLGDLDVTGTCDALGDSKPCAVADFPDYNAAHVMLIDTHGRPRTLWCREDIQATVMTSCFDDAPPAEVNVNWTLKTLDGDQTFVKGSFEGKRLKYPGVGVVGDLSIPTPELSKPACLVLSIEAKAGDYRMANRWKFWAFPRFDPKTQLTGKRICTTVPWVQKTGLASMSAEEILEPTKADLLVTDRLGAAELQYLEKGGRMLLLQNCAKEGLSCTPHVYRHRMYHPQISGDSMGVVVHDHPALGDFPHEGFNDLQFFQLMQSQCYRLMLDDMPARVTPILESVPSLENNQSKNSGFLFEVGIGKGKLLATGLRLDLAKDGECTSSHMLAQFIDYCTGNTFNPTHSVDASAMADAIKKAAERVWIINMVNFDGACPLPCTVPGQPLMTSWIAPRGLTGWHNDEWGWHGEGEATDGYRCTYWEATTMPADLGADWGGKPVKLSKITVEFLDGHSLPAEDGWQVQVRSGNGDWKTLPIKPRRVADLTWWFDLGGVTTDQFRLFFEKMSDEALKAEGGLCCRPRVGDPFPVTRVKERALPRIREMKVELTDQ